jgi:hypothetical protein
MPAPIKIKDKETTSHTYLGNIITSEGGTKEDIHSRLGKARRVSREMNNIWRSTQYSTNTKLKLYQNCVVSTLLDTDQNAGGLQRHVFLSYDPSIQHASTKYFGYSGQKR